MKPDITAGGRTFQIINYTVMFILCLTFIYPFVYTLAVSLSDAKHILEGSVFLFPKGFTLSAYRAVLSDQGLLHSLFFTAMLTVCGVAASIIMTTLAAYPLSRTGLKGTGIILRLIVFTMYFNGGIIPTYLLVKNLGLLDTMGALIWPDVIQTFLLIIMISYFRGIPVELEEAAKVEGCSNFGILVKIIVPLAKPVIATLVIYYAVSYWNMFQQALMYIQSPARYTLQIKLYQVLNVFQQDLTNSLDAASAKTVLPENLKGAMVLVTAVPILFVYPWLQKYFIKGVTIGSLKG
ncbi:putative aldouronate transport system permease protein [Hydrogenispora ethanolica]|uniref:Putative aldouronate transport system permease protein n=1 Tax=Hydrogenispora ethanolica TaxID=1082276 RepID=A0A4R1SAU9_HYDET|nr:carbohydrate ABC transporter permease [Hydrogenispora ethanolica]TCL76499.1 putative aldouronate transport system permease protein [Hydrogenispora ethanolica]